MAYELKDKSGSLVKHQGEQVFGHDLAGVVKSFDAKNRKMTIVGSDETIDRAGDIIRVSGWMLDNYQKNPVFLWAHNYSSVPLASTEKITIRRVPNKHMEHTVKFPTEGIHPFADMIYNLYGQKVINACSVGFIPKKFEKRERLEDEDEDEYKQYWGPREYLKQELLELSGCAIPANPNALQNALKGLGVEFGVTEEGLEVPEEYLIPKMKDDVLGELNVKTMEIVDETKAKLHIVPAQIESSSTTPDVPSSSFRSTESDDDDEDEDVVKEFDEIDVSEKPYPNEHACRLNDPGKYDRFNRNNCAQKHDGKCIDVIYGIKSGKSEIQALRYKRSIWTSSSAKSHCSGRGGSFEAASGNDYDEIFNSAIEQLRDVEKTLMKRIEDMETSLKSLSEEISSVAESFDNADKGNLYDIILGPKGRSSDDEGAETKPVDAQLEKKVDGLINVLKQLKQYKREK